MILRFFAFLCVVFSCFYTVTASANSEILSDISAYLAKMKTAEGRFIQVGPDGVISEGDFALKRPGKMFFDYAPPMPLKVVSDGFWVAVEDNKIGTKDRYPLNETPLKILLAEKPDFTNTDYNIRLENDKDGLRVHASDPKSPEQGSITLVFTNNPIELRQWIVTDAQGLQTVVSIQDVKMNAPVANKLFFVENETGNKRNK